MRSTDCKDANKQLQLAYYYVRVLTQFDFGEFSPRKDDNAWSWSSRIDNS